MQKYRQICEQLGHIFEEVLERKLGKLVSRLGSGLDKGLVLQGEQSRK